MSYPIISELSPPDSLRWLADKLESDTLTDTERYGIAVSLILLAEEISPTTPAPSTAPSQPDTTAPTAKAADATATGGIEGPTE